MHYISNCLIGTDDLSNKIGSCSCIHLRLNEEIGFCKNFSFFNEGIGFCGNFSLFISVLGMVAVSLMKLFQLE